MHLFVTLFVHYLFQPEKISVVFYNSLPIHVHFMHHQSCHFEFPVIFIAVNSHNSWLSVTNDGSDYAAILTANKN